MNFSEKTSIAIVAINVLSIPIHARNIAHGTHVLLSSVLLVLSLMFLLYGVLVLVLWWYKRRESPRSKKGL